MAVLDGILESAGYATVSRFRIGTVNHRLRIVYNFSVVSSFHFVWFSILSRWLYPFVS